MSEKVRFNSDSNGNPSSLQRLWIIILLFGSYPGWNTKIYAVRFISKLAGNYSKTFLEIELREKSKDTIRVLNSFGVMDQVIFQLALNQVKSLKLNGIFDSVDSLLPYLDPDEGEIEAQRLYEQLVNECLSTAEMFPTISSGEYKRGESDGVILDTPQYVAKYGLRDGVGAIGVTTEFVKDILGIEQTRGADYQQVTGTWLKQGHLLKRDKGARCQDSVQPCPDREDKQRFIVLRIPDLQARLTQASENKEELDHE